MPLTWIGDVGCEGREHKRESFQNTRHGSGGDALLLGIELVDQFHDGGNTRVEVPARFEILGDLAEGLV